MPTALVNTFIEIIREIKRFAFIKEFIAPEWRQILVKQGLDGFDTLWRLKSEPLDEPNKRRDGWSEATSWLIELSGGSQKRLILKRQQNYTSRTPFHPFRGIPTFKKEFINIMIFKRLGLPTIEPVYYAQRNIAGGLQAILITEHLEGYTSLDKLADIRLQYGQPNSFERNRIITAIASLMHKVHLQGMQHNHLYPKHIFIRQISDEIHVRLIDLEGSKWRPLGDGRRVRDLESLHRRSKGWNRGDRLRFLKAYCNIQQIDGKTKKLYRKIAKRNQGRM